MGLNKKLSINKSTDSTNVCNAYLCVNNVNAKNITAGVLIVHHGGTGQSSYTNGQLLIGNSTGNILTKSTLTAGQNILITNGAGSITIGFTGVLPVSNGGTGQSSYTIGDLLYASGSTTLSKLADIATGNVLISGGVGSAPSYGKVDLTSHVSNVLPIANGGTNISTYTTGDLLYSSATNVLSKLPIGSAYQALKMNSGATNVEWGNNSNIYYASTTSNATFTVNDASTIAYVDSIPQITEGIEYLTLTYTPKSTTSTLHINFYVSGVTEVTSGFPHLTLALFVDTTPDALASSSIGGGNVVGLTNTFYSFTFSLTSGSTTARTYRIRMGWDTNSIFDSNFYINSISAGSRIFGGVNTSILELFEIF